MAEAQPQFGRAPEAPDPKSADLPDWGARLHEHRDRLLRMVAFRLDPRLKGRVDATDIVQEAYLEATEHRDDYLRVRPPVPLFLWLRGVVSNKLLEIHRHHLGTHMRDAAREVCVRGSDELGNRTSISLAAQLSGHYTRPSRAAARAEVKDRLEQALDSMDAIDREVLALRHFEQLTNAEAAEVLGIQERAAAKRYVRALKRLKEILAAMPGGLTEVRP
jgi:RNA polymerase sigma-70 factor (ECF subfamily)